MNGNKGGIGVGSASIILVFAVLCLTVFSLITFVVASNDKALVDAEARLITGFYKADAHAERIIAEILEADSIPSAVQGVEIEHQWDTGLNAELVEFTCPAAENKALYIRLAVSDDSHDILSWIMYDTDEWNFDDRLEVWSGPGEVEIGDPSDVFSGLVVAE